MALSRDNVVIPHEFSLFQPTTGTENKAETEEQLFNEVSSRLENAQDYINSSILQYEKIIEEKLKDIPEQEKVEVKQNIILTIKILAILKIEVEKNKNFEIQYDKINKCIVDKDNNRYRGDLFHSISIPKSSFENFLFCLIKNSKSSRNTLLTMIHLMMLYSLSPDVVNHTSELKNLPKTLNYFNVHRLIVASFLSAYKFHHGHVVNSEVAKLFNLPVKELNAMELTFLREIKWNLYGYRKVHNLYALKLNELDLMIPENPMELMPDLEHTQNNSNSVISQEGSSSISTTLSTEQSSSNTETLLNTTQVNVTPSKKRKDAPVLNEDKHINKKASIDANNTNATLLDFKPEFNNGAGFIAVPLYIMIPQSVVNKIQNPTNLFNFFNTTPIKKHLEEMSATIIKGIEENRNMVSDDQNPANIHNFFNPLNKNQPAEVPVTTKGFEVNSNSAMDIDSQQINIPH